MEKNYMNSDELLVLIPRPWKLLIVSSILASIILLIATFIDSSLSNTYFKHLGVVIFFSFIFVKTAKGERKQFVALNSLREDEIISEVKAATNMIFLKTILTSTIVILPFTLGTEISDTLRVFLLIASLLITWHNIYIGLAGEFRYRYVKMILAKVIEEKEKNT
ncbi:hypothetical protein A499_18419 [Niallia nealsonii AAU1]|nr:hypothetical protein A499_18419 [Niallia nealsonii AAU1]